MKSNNLLNLKLVNSLIHLREKFQNMNISYIFLYLILVISFRVFLEVLILNYEVIKTPFIHYSRLFLENFFYFLLVFLVGSFLVSFLSGIKYFEVLKDFIFASIFICLTPVIDYFFSNVSGGYYYATVENLIINIISFTILSPDLSLGVKIQAVSVFTSVFLYIYFRRKSILLAFLGILFFELFIILLSTPSLFFGQFADYYFDFFIPSYYFLPSILLILLIAILNFKSKLIAVILNFRFTMLFVYSLIFLMGFFQYIFLNSFESINFLHLFLSLLSIFLVWEVSVFLNDIFDLKIDEISNKNRPLVKNTLSITEFYFLSFLFSFLALSFSASINFLMFLIVFILFYFAIIYSVKPIQLRKNFLGNILIGISSGLVFLIGFISSNANYLVLPTEIFIQFLLIIFSFIVLSFMKDIKDIDGDLNEGIKNIFTLFSKKKAKLIISVLIFCILTLNILFFEKYYLLIIALLLSCIYYKFEKMKLVYLLSTLLLFIIYTI